MRMLRVPLFDRFVVWLFVVVQLQCLQRQIWYLDRMKYDHVRLEWVEGSPIRLYIGMAFRAADMHFPWQFILATNLR